MPTILKDPAIEVERLQFSETDPLMEVQAILYESTVSHDSVAKFFAPKSFTAKLEFESRKEKQRVNRHWQSDIARRTSELQMNQQRIQEMVTKARNNNNSGGIGV